MWDHDVARRIVRLGGRKNYRVYSMFDVSCVVDSVRVTVIAILFVNRGGEGIAGRFVERVRNDDVDTGLSDKGYIRGNR